MPILLQATESSFGCLRQPHQGRNPLALMVPPLAAPPARPANAWYDVADRRQLRKPRALLIMLFFVRQVLVASQRLYHSFCLFSCWALLNVVGARWSAAAPTYLAGIVHHIPDQFCGSDAAILEPQPATVPTYRSRLVYDRGVYICPFIVNKLFFTTPARRLIMHPKISIGIRSSPHYQRQPLPFLSACVYSPCRTTRM